MTDIGHKDPNERPGEQATTHAGKVLVAYLSRPGENYYYGDRTRLEVGNTKVVAAMIAELIDCDIHEIRAADPYPDAYDACVDRNKREQDDEARPEIANPLGDTDKYDVVLVGSPIWNVRTPMIMETFAGSHSFAGKTIHPFVTYAVSQLGSAERDYRRSLKERPWVMCSLSRARRPRTPGQKLPSGSTGSALPHLPVIQARSDEDEESSWPPRHEGFR